MWAGGEVLTGEAEKGKMPAGEVEMNDFLTEQFPNFHRNLFKSQRQKDKIIGEIPTLKAI